MTAKYTPGPWEAFRNSSFWEINPTNGGENGIPFSVADVCSSSPGFPDGGLQEANARLIAAAPELLEVAQGILVEDMPQYLPAEYIAKVRAVIAKATGAHND